MRQATLPLAFVASYCVLSAALAAPPTVKPITASGLKKEVAKLKGKVVVVNFWATWCPPCVAEFPDLVATQKKLAGKGVELLTVSLDDTDDLKKAVVPFLSKNGVAKGAFINKDGQAPDMGFFTWLEGKTPSSLGIPRTYILNRQGKVVAKLVGGQDGAAFEAAVKKALAGK